VAFRLAGSMAELGCATYETAVLEISYLSPDVTELAGEPRR